LTRNVFGGFVEHLGRCIYGGIYDEGSPLSDQHGFRTDVLALLRDLRPGVLRWPGGNFVSNYHWADGTGPKDSRPRRPELAWGSEEPNRFFGARWPAAVRCTSAPAPTMTERTFSQSHRTRALKRPGATHDASPPIPSAAASAAAGNPDL
jgi:alpha-L-arabinofuranosidase